MKNRLYTAALCGCLALGVTAGCASEEPSEVARATSQAPTTTPTRAPSEAPGAQNARVKPSLDAAATIRAHARWLPANTDMVFTADARSSANLVDFWSVAGDSPRAAKIRSRFDAMMGELGELSNERLGMNPLGMTAIVGGLDIEGEMGTLIVLGATVAAKDTVKMGAFDTFKIVPRHAADAAELSELSELPAKDQPWALALPDGAGVVISTRGILEKIAASDSASLAKSEALETFTTGLTGAPTHFAAAIGRSFFEAAAEKDGDENIGHIEFATFAMNEITSTVVIRSNSDDDLVRMEKEYRDAVAKGTSKMKGLYDTRNDQSTPEAFVAIAGYHGVLALDESIKMERKPGVMTITMHNASLSSLSSLSSLLDMDDDQGDD